MPNPKEWSLAMAKLKTSLLSFGAKGTLGDTLTFQDRNRGTMAREKPVPAQPRTLAQMYQRWLYQDYVAYWHDQTAATQQLWETNARRHHMTGFAYWMQYHLANLPDIAGMWHLDRIVNNSVIDFSKNANHGVVHGAIPADGVIDKALYFDNLDDYINCGLHPSLNITGDLTIEAIVRRDSNANYDTILCKGPEAGTPYELLFEWGRDRFYYLHQKLGGGIQQVFSTETFTTSLFWRIAVTRKIGGNLIIYKNGLPDITTPVDGTPTSDLNDLLLGKRSDGHPLGGILDEVCLYYRSLTPSDVKRHAERKYPL